VSNVWVFVVFALPLMPKLPPSTKSLPLPTPLYKICVAGAPVVEKSRVKFPAPGRTVVAPVKMFVPPRVKPPFPNLVRPALPARGELIVAANVEGTRIEGVPVSVSEVPPVNVNPVFMNDNPVVLSVPLRVTAPAVPSNTAAPLAHTFVRAPLLEAAQFVAVAFQVEAPFIQYCCAEAGEISAKRHARPAIWRTRDRKCFADVVAWRCRRVAKCWFFMEVRGAGYFHKFCLQQV
jgi:hypothetical protein